MESKHMSGQMNIWERINAENINQQGINRTSMAESAEKDRASQQLPLDWGEKEEKKKWLLMSCCE